MKYYNYEDLSITSAKKPENTHLIWEVSTSLIYMVDSTNNKVLLRSVDKSENWTTIATRTYNIVGGFHDRTNNKIYFVDGVNDSFKAADQNFASWYITTTLGSENPTEMGAYNDANGYIMAWDIIKLGSDFYIAGTYYVDATHVRGGFYKWVDPNWVFQAGYSEINPTTNSFGQHSFVLSTDVSTVYFWRESSSRIHFLKWETAGTQTSLKAFGIGDYDHPTSMNQYGISYDDTDKFYMVLERLSDNKMVLIYYSITDADVTELGEYNVCLMMDRNTNSVQEKAFHLTEYKVYQLHPNMFQLHFIAKIPATTAIIAITDNFLICDDVGTNEFPFYEFVDMSSYMTRVEFAHEIMNYSEGTLGVNRDVFTIEKGMFMQIIGTFTTDELDRLFKGTYNFGDEAVGSEPSGWTVNGYTAGTIQIIASKNGHKKVVEITSDGTGGSDPGINNRFSSVDDEYIEFWLYKEDVAQTVIQIKEGGTQCIYIRWSGGEAFQDYHTGAYHDIGGGTLSADEKHHFKIYTDKDTGWDLWIDGVNIFTDRTYRNTPASGITILQFTVEANNDGNIYLDAVGYSWDANYDVGDNQSVEAGETDQVIFEGIVVDFDGERLQKVWLESPAKKELLNVKPRGSFSGRSDEIMTSLLSTYCKYITKGTFSVGTAMGTVTYAGDKSLMSILIELALFEKWIWKLRPQGQLDFNDGTVDSLVDLSSSDKIFRVKTGEIREPYNYFYIKGAIVNMVQLYKELEEADDLVSQQLHGYNPFEETFASFNAQTILDQLTANVKARLKETPLVVEHWHYDADLGMITHGETVTFVYNTTNVNVSSDQFLINRILFKAKDNAGGYTIADKLI